MAGRGKYIPLDQRDINVRSWEDTERDSNRKASAELLRRLMEHHGDRPEAALAKERINQLNLLFIERRPK